MLPNDDYRMKLAQRVEISKMYQEFMQGLGGNELKVYLSNRYQFLNTQLLLEQEFRDNKVSTDVIRGQLIQLADFYEFLNGKLLDEYKANDQIIRLENKEST